MKKFKDLLTEITLQRAVTKEPILNKIKKLFQNKFDKTNNNLFFMDKKDAIKRLKSYGLSDEEIKTIETVAYSEMKKIMTKYNIAFRGNDPFVLHGFNLFWERSFGDEKTADKAYKEYLNNIKQKL